MIVACYEPITGIWNGLAQTCVPGGPRGTGTTLSLHAGVFSIRMYGGVNVTLLQTSTTEGRARGGAGTPRSNRNIVKRECACHVASYKRFAAKRRSEPPWRAPAGRPRGVRRCPCALSCKGRVRDFLRHPVIGSVARDDQRLIRSTRGSMEPCVEQFSRGAPRALKPMTGNA